MTDPESPPTIYHAEPFDNEPHSDFGRSDVREAFAQALETVQAQLGEEYPLLINGKASDTRKRIVSINPSHRRQHVGSVACASEEHAEKAIEAARRALPRWSQTEAKIRAEYLELMAAEMRNQRFELAAWEVVECGKPWAEADADVAEAIDFCNYYAAQMRDLAVPVQCDFQGEENSYFYRPRGVSVVIAPWNFPLAILTGMTAAAMVAGNCVIMKPAEQSPVIAAKLMQIAQDAGIPNGVLNYLPGIGEEIGPHLVSHQDVDIIAFTGSQQVGLEINRLATEIDTGQRGVKRVIAEMGGKNAIIVDSDADLDEAVMAVVDSAFGYSGQKCSACSRVVVMDDCHDVFVERLQAATESLIVGPAEAPGSSMGPVIDAESQERILDYIAIGKDECQTIASLDVGELADEGFFVGPHVFADVDRDSRIAQNEIFGPVLSVIRAADFDEAIDIANDTRYALTAGIFSRSPRNLQRARTELQAGNIYLNRGITGAMVQRHPFGGYKLSGIGSKAGGRDYLLQFVIPINVTENTLRRGFAPPPDETKA